MQCGPVGDILKYGRVGSAVLPSVFMDRSTARQLPQMRSSHQATNRLVTPSAPQRPQPAGARSSACVQLRMASEVHAACASCCALGVPALVSAHSIRPPAPRARTAAASACAFGTVMTAPPQACGLGRREQCVQSAARARQQPQRQVASYHQHRLPQQNTCRAAAAVMQPACVSNRPSNRECLAPRAGPAPPSALCCTAARSGSTLAAPPAASSAGTVGTRVL